MLSGFLIDYLMGFVYFVVLRFRTKFALKRKYLYYIGWILSLLVFSFVFLLLNKKLSFNLIAFLSGILIAQISVVSFYFYKEKKIS